MQQSLYAELSPMQREPDALFFEQLPQALGFDPFGPSTEQIQKRLMRFLIPCEVHCPS